MFWNVTNALLEGMGTTVELFALTLLFSLPIGLLVAFGSMSKWAPFRFLAQVSGAPRWFKKLACIRPIKLLVDFIVWVIRGTPLMLQLMIIYFGPGKWDAQQSAAQNEKLINREAMRLELSLERGAALRGSLPGYEHAELIALLHYPPVSPGQKSRRLLEILLKYGVRRCFYGHIHGPGKATAVTGLYEGVEFSLISADFLSFCPQKLNKTVSF